MLSYFIMFKPTDIKSFERASVIHSFIYFKSDSVARKTEKNTKVYKTTKK